ncbi:hypothetical protein Ciccas_011444 [Cichlidogyrus casuarinus]|uniref:RRM domain-containing protein n=1 Tax=Cichlidogyrus casuarinus TaxID=1844966 RepID=A0ABD2PW07_9PLAT
MDIQIGQKRTRSDSSGSYTDADHKNTKYEVSPVVFVRSLPDTVTEREVALLAIPFGRIKVMIIVKKSSQALLELHNLQDAINMVSYYVKYPVQLHGVPINVTFSKYQFLDAKSEPTSIRVAIDTSNNIIEQDLPDTKSGDPNCILRVQIDNVMNQKINHLVLIKIFKRFGNILRLVLYMRNDRYNCLIEFETYVMAYAALLLLNGQNIYTDCCTLIIEFSKISGPLEIRHQSDNCRDYTQCPLTQSEQDILNETRPDASAASFEQPIALKVEDYKFQVAEPSKNGPVKTEQNVQALAMQLSIKVSPDGLFTLFGVYADVQRVKIMFNNKSQALVQLSNPTSVNTVLQNLSNQPLFGKPLKLSLSRHAFIQLPTSETIDTLTKDYTSSRLHRFRQPNSRNHFNIYPPSRTLHLSSLKPGMSQEEMVSIFTEAGFDVCQSRFLGTDRRMALVTLNSVDQAMQALMLLHNYQISVDLHLRVSFSRDY